MNQTQTRPQAALRQAGKQTGKLHHYSSLHTARCSAPSRLPQAAPSAPRLTWQASSLHPSKAVPASLFSKGYSVISSESLIKGYTKYVVSGRANYHLPGQCRSAALNPGLLTNSPVSCGTQGILLQNSSHICCLGFEINTSNYTGLTGSLNTVPLLYTR